MPYPVLTQRMVLPGAGTEVHVPSYEGQQGLLSSYAPAVRYLVLKKTNGTPRNASSLSLSAGKKGCEVSLGIGLTAILTVLTAMS
eukprot:2734445-Rhodomonas_salina.7